MEKKKTYVLDTTVLIYDPDIFYKLGDADIVVPLAVIKELDGLKNSGSELVAQAARKVARTLDRWGSYADLITGVKLPTNARVYIYTDYEKIDGLESQADNRIVGAALKIKRESDGDVFIMSTDINMRNIARAHGIEPKGYENVNLSPVEKLEGNKMKSNVNPTSNYGKSKIKMFLKAFLRYLFPRRLRAYVYIFVAATIGFYSLTYLNLAVSMFFGFITTGMLKIMTLSHSERVRENPGVFHPGFSNVPGNVYDEINPDKTN